MQHGVKRVSTANMLVIVALETDIIINNRMMFDSWLGGILALQHGDVERAKAEVPIARVHGVPAASQAFFDPLHGHRMGKAVFGQYYSGYVMNSRRLQDTLTVVPSKIEAKRGVFQNVISVVRTLPTSRLYFLARGDVEAVSRILRGVKFMGARRKAGFGKIADIEVTEAQSGNPCFGIVGGGQVLRPIPLRFRDRFPAAEHAILTETWQNPYPKALGGDAEPCLVPNLMTGEGFTFDEVESFYS